MASGAMPWLSSSPSLASSGRRKPRPPLGRFPWWEVAHVVGSGRSSFNKLGFCPSDRDLEAGCGGVLRCVAPLLLHRHGGEKKGGVTGFVAPRGDIEAATSGVHQWWRSGADVILGRCGHSVLWCCKRHSSFNLQADEPSRRPFNSSAAESYVAPSPSGAVPGDGADGRSVELIFFLAGEGPNRVFQSLDGVLFFVKVEDLVVFSFYYEVSW